MEQRELYKRAIEALETAEGLLHTSGAGMGCDAGLPDYRSSGGFWQLYPPLEKLGLGFKEMSRPELFLTDPALAWGFYGHKMELFRDALPHPGYDIIKQWFSQTPWGGYVVTSNVDGLYPKAGFSEFYEYHGSLYHWQCHYPCRQDIWPAEELKFEVDMQTIRAKGTLPKCVFCGEMARPNALFFGDAGWVSGRSARQGSLYHQWRESIPTGKMVVLECGAGTGLPVIRRLGEQLQHAYDATLIRINPLDPEGPEGTISLKGRALDVLQELHTLRGA